MESDNTSDTVTMGTRKWAIGIGLFVVLLTAGLAFRLGLAFAVIIGGSGLIAFASWLVLGYPRPADPDRVLTLFLIVIAGELVHQIEEYVMRFPQRSAEMLNAPAMTPDFFVVLILTLAAVGVTAAAGLQFGHPLANYVMWFIVIGPGFVNGVAHVIFPFLAGQPYFPGLLTVWLPVVPGIVLIRRLYVDAHPDRPSSLIG